MNRDAKRISSSLRPDIDKVKSYIREAVRPFDGDGYVFKSAIKELRRDGLKIKYNNTICAYEKM